MERKLLAIAAKLTDLEADQRRHRDRIEKLERKVRDLEHDLDRAQADLRSRR